MAALRRGSRSGFDQGSTRASRVVAFWASRVVASSFLSLALRRCSFRQGLSPSAIRAWHLPKGLWDKPRGIQCMPSGFTPVVIDLRPSMKVMIPWDKPKGIQCMPSGFTPVVIDLCPSVKVTIPWDKPKGQRESISTCVMSTCEGLTMVSWPSFKPSSHPQDAPAGFDIRD